MVRWKASRDLRFVGTFLSESCQLYIYIYSPFDSERLFMCVKGLCVSDMRSIKDLPEKMAPTSSRVRRRPISASLDVDDEGASAEASSASGALGGKPPSQAQ